MGEFEKMLLYKDGRYSTDVYKILREVNDSYIVKKIDTITSEEEILAITKKEAEESMYTVKEFFENATYVGYSGHYEELDDLHKYLSQSIILIYKDDYNDLYFDTLSKITFISSSDIPLDEFVPNNVRHDYSFKKGLGKK